MGLLNYELWGNITLKWECLRGGMVMESDISWFIDQIARITVRTEHSLLGQLKPQFQAFDEQEKILTLRFPVQLWEVNQNERLTESVLQGMMDLTMSLIVKFYNRKAVSRPVGWQSSCAGYAKYNDTVVIEASLATISSTEATVMCMASTASRGSVFAQSTSIYTCKKD